MRFTSKKGLGNNFFHENMWRAKIFFRDKKGGQDFFRSDIFPKPGQGTPWIFLRPEWHVIIFHLLI